MNWHQILTIGGTWVAGLAIPIGGLVIAYHAQMRTIGCEPNYPSERHHLRRMGQAAAITGGVVLLGWLLYGLGRMVGPR